MAIATTLQDCLERTGARYDIIHHSRTHNSMETAQAAHIPGYCLAKTVILEDDHGYLAAVLPSTHHILLSELCEHTGRQLRLANEYELAHLFKDCELGAIPPIAMAYGMTTVVDDSLTKHPDVYFEAGDHEELIHVRLNQFLDLMSAADRSTFSHSM
jgi:Ala-tRNA(Pro) deacylase